MKASARIQVTLDVPVVHGGSWADGTDIRQLRSEAVDAGLKKLQTLLDAAGGGAAGVRVIGEPHVTIVLVEDL